MTDHSIHCADCGHPATAKRKNQRYCGVCRLFRNLIYLGGRTVRCASCDTKFAPLHVNDKLCADCDFDKEKLPKGRCAFCEQDERPLVKEDVSICIACAKDPSHRDKVTRALGKKRRQRQEARDD